MSIKKYDSKLKKWIVEASSNALTTSILDINNNFKSKNVEGALEELGNKMKEIKYDSNKLNTLYNDFSEHLINHPSGSGGGETPGSIGKISEIKVPKDFELTEIEENKDIEIPIYFVSGVSGDGTIFININNSQYYTTKIKQGRTTNIIIPGFDSKKFGTSFILEIVGQDRNEVYSNSITFNCFCGGIKCEILADMSRPFDPTDIIVMPYKVEYGGQDNITFHMKVNNELKSVSCINGTNTYNFGKMPPGSYKISYYVEAGKYKTKEKIFILDIATTDALIVNSLFDEDETYYTNSPINIPIKISKKTTNWFHINFYIKKENEDYGNIIKTLDSKTSEIIYWTTYFYDKGNYTIKAEVIEYNSDGAESIDSKYIEIKCNILESKTSDISYTSNNLMAYFDSSKKNNLDSDKDIWKDETNSYTAKLIDVNYSSNGWIDRELVLNGGAYVEIDLSPFKDNIPNGITIDTLVYLKDIGDLDARIFSIEDPSTGYGFYITPYKMYANTSYHNSETMLVNDEWIHLTFTIDKFNKFGKMYINGVMQEVFYLIDSGASSTNNEQISTSQKIYLNSRRGEDHFGYCKFKNIRIYYTSLTDDECLMNYIYDIEDTNKRIRKFRDNFPEKNNNIYTMPRMILTPESDNWNENIGTDLNHSVRMSCEYKTSNPSLFGESFSANTCNLYIQGTSSKQYVMKNFNIVLKKDNSPFEYFLGQSVESEEEKSNAISENLFCLKCNYMESSNSNNNGITDYINRYLYDDITSPTPAKEKNKNFTHAIKGFPIMLYIGNEFQGIYDFNLDRYSVKSFGYTSFKNCLSYEIGANTDVSAGAFVEYDKNNPLHAEHNETSYYAESFSPIYPEERRGKTKDGSNIDTFDEIKKLVKFVSNADEDLFKSDFEKWFDKQSVIRYYLVVYTLAMVDNLGKNMKITNFDTKGEENAKWNKWFLQFYDCDTALGLNNSGAWLYDKNLSSENEKDSKKRLDVDFDMTSGLYNTANSNLWTKLRLWFADDIREEYINMRQNNFTEEKLLECIYDNNINRIPERYYNMSFQKKYLDYGDKYIDQMHGSRYYDVKRWLHERFIYMDTLMKNFIKYDKESLMLRSDEIGEISFDIEVFTPMVVKVTWQNVDQNDNHINTAVDEIKVKRGEVKTFSHINKAQNQEVTISGGSNIKTLGHLNRFNPTELLLNNATKITNLECQNSKNLIILQITNCKNLQNINVKGCSMLGNSISTQTLNVVGMYNLKYINVQGTKIMTIATDSYGGNIQEMYLSSFVESISCNNLQLLKVIGFERGHNCKIIKIINCPNIESFGDKVWNPIYNQYTYEDGYFLSGVKYLELDNTFLKSKYLGIYKSDGLESIKVTNMPNLECIEIGSNNLYDWKCKINDNNEMEDSIPHVKLQSLINAPSLKISSFGCSKLKTINFTTDNMIINYAKLKTGEFEYIDYEAQKDDLQNNIVKSTENYYKELDNSDKLYRYFMSSKIDLSETNIETLNIAISLWTYNLLLPTTLKNLYINNRYFLNNLTEENREKIINYTLEDPNKISKFEEEQIPLANTPCQMLSNFIGSITTTESDSKYTKDTDKYKIWDFEGIIFDNIMAWGFNRTPWYRGITEIDSNNNVTHRMEMKNSEPLNYTWEVTIKNLNEKPINNAFAIEDYWCSSIENGSIDLSNFVGKNLTRALYMIDENKINITFKSNENFDWMDNIKYCDKMIFNSNLKSVSPKIIEKIFRKATFINQFGTIKLKDQISYEEDGLELYNDIIINNEISDNQTLLGNSNIKFIKSLKMEKNLCGYRLFSNNKILEKIGEIYLSYKDSNDLGNIYIPPSYKHGLKNAFINCTNLKSVDKVTFDATYVKNENLQSQPHSVDFTNCFNNCQSLTDFGDLNLINIKNYWDGANLIGYKPDSSCNSFFYNCKNLKNIGNLKIDYISNLNYFFYNCLNITNMKSINFSSALTMEHIVDQCVYDIDFTTYFENNINKSNYISYDKIFYGYKSNQVFKFKIPNTAISCKEMFKQSYITDESISYILPDEFINPCNCDYMFMECYKLKDFVNLPEGTSSMNGYMYKCTNICSELDDKGSYNITIPSTCSQLDDFCIFGNYMKVININIPDKIITMKNFLSQLECNNVLSLSVNLTMPDGDLVDLRYAFKNSKNILIYNLNLNRIKTICNISISSEGVKYDNSSLWGAYSSNVILYSFVGKLNYYYFKINGNSCVKSSTKGYKYLFDNLEKPIIPKDKYNNLYEAKIFVPNNIINQDDPSQTVLTDEQINNAKTLGWKIINDE